MCKLKDFWFVNVEWIMYFVSIKHDWFVWNAYLESDDNKILVKTKSPNITEAMERLDTKFFELIKKSN